MQKTLKVKNVSGYAQKLGASDFAPAKVLEMWKEDDTSTEYELPEEVAKELCSRPDFDLVDKAPKRRGTREARD